MAWKNVDKKVNILLAIGLRLLAQFYMIHVCNIHWVVDNYVLTRDPEAWLTTVKAENSSNDL